MYGICGTIGERKKTLLLARDLAAKGRLRTQSFVKGWLAIAADVLSRLKEIPSS